MTVRVAPTPRAPRTPKAETTRAAIRDAALALFAARGYRATTLREIADRAGTSVGLTYRYFPSKESIVVSVYADIAAALEARTASLPPSSLGTGFAAIVDAKLSLLAPHKEAFVALVGPALDPTSSVAVSGDASASVRATMDRIFTRLVDRATDVPADAPRGDLVVTLYAAHLLVLLAWVHDRSPSGKVTREVIDFLRRALDGSSAFLAMPFVTEALTRFGPLLRSLLESGAPGAAADESLERKRARRR